MLIRFMMWMFLFMSLDEFWHWCWDCLCCCSDLDVDVAKNVVVHGCRCRCRCWKVEKVFCCKVGEEGSDQAPSLKSMMVPWPKSRKFWFPNQNHVNFDLFWFTSSFVPQKCVWSPDHGGRGLSYKDRVIRAPCPCLMLMLMLFCYKVWESDQGSLSLSDVDVDVGGDGDVASLQSLREWSGLLVGCWCWRWCWCCWWWWCCFVTKFERVIRAPCLSALLLHLIALRQMAQRQPAIFTIVENTKQYILPNPRKL